VTDYSEIRNSHRFKVGVPQEYFGEGIDAEVDAEVRGALELLQKSGAVEVKRISLPHSRYAIAAYYIIATAEASSNLSRYDGVRYGLRSEGDLPLRRMYERTREDGFGDEVKRRVMLGTFALSSGYYDAYYLQASRVRNLIAQDFRKAFGEVDLICTPTAPTAAFKLGEKTNDPLAMYLSDIYTVTLNLAGLPAISVPCGFTSAKLPVGLQIVGNYLEEKKVFQFASRYLRERPVQLPEIS
jgi:aspartyl-tRNA(Asn)/glutamyl-tRNA(Gln) amidotransferase subunit A